MSSSNSNAAARRRRAAPQQPPSQNSIAGRLPPQVNRQPQSQQLSGQSSTETTGATPLYSNPAQMLIAHEGRLAKLEESLPGLLNGSSSTMNESSNDSANVKELEDKIASLEHELRMLKSFAIETNVAMLKYLNNAKTVSDAETTLNTNDEAEQSDNEGQPNDIVE
jgi:hypothetical protein